MHKHTLSLALLALGPWLVAGCSSGSSPANPSDGSTVGVTVGGSVAGLRGSGLVLVDEKDELAVTAGSRSFRMPTTLAAGNGYAITVKSQPAGQTCAITNGSGTVGSADVADVAVRCGDDAFAVGGSVAGLSIDGLVLANGADRVVVAAGATAFAMPTAVATGAGYAVTVDAQPAGVTCSVSAGSGTVGAAEVRSVAVTCAANAHQLGGTIAGLFGSGLVLANGSDSIAIAANATGFVLPTPVAEGAAYGVSVQSQPAGLTCSVASATGTMGAADVGTVAVGCSPIAYALGGSIAGLTLDGLTLANGTDSVAAPAGATSFVLTAPVAYGAGYSVVVQSQPNWLHCDVASGSGAMPAADVTGVAVTCAQSAWVATIAGTAGVTGSTDATGGTASFSHPFGIAIDSHGDYFVGDLNNNEVRRVTAAGVVSTFAGSTTRGSADGTGSAAGFYAPAGIAIDAADNLYVVDRLNFLVRKITPAGVVSTLAGSGSWGVANGNGAAASFGSMYGLAVDSAGNVYVADMSNNQIRQITPTGDVTTFAGSSTPGSADGIGAAASFSSPAGVAVDSDDNVYVSEVGNHRIRKITPAGLVTTIAGAGTAGNTDGTGSAAKFNQPYGLAVDRDGVIYVADTLGNKIRRVTQAGVVTTLAGSATGGHLDANGTAATLYLPTTLAFDAAGNLVIADYNNNVIRRIAR